jgi:hypothetical protein
MKITPLLHEVANAADQKSVRQGSSSAQATQVNTETYENYEMVNTEPRKLAPMAIGQSGVGINSRTFLGIGDFPRMRQ